MNFIESYRSKWIEELPFPVRKYGSRAIGFGFKIGSHETIGINRNRGDGRPASRLLYLLAPLQELSQIGLVAGKSLPGGPELLHAVHAILAFSLLASPECATV